MTHVLDSLRTNIRERQAQTDTVRRAQAKRGTLCNAQGLIKGVSLNTNGNRAYTLVSSVGVVNAYVRNPLSTFQPGTGVTLEYDQELRHYYITGLDAEAFAAVGATVQRSNPISMGDSLYLDSGFILDGLSQPVFATEVSSFVEIKPLVLYYYDGGVEKRYEYDGNKVDLAAYVASSGNHSILQIWLDPFNQQLQYTQSTEQAVTSAFDSTDWDETLSAAGNWLPLQAYEMTDTSDTSITQKNKLRDNRPIYTLPTEGEASGIHPIATYENPLTVDSTLPDGYETLTRGVQTEASGIVRTTLGVWWDSGDGSGGSGSSGGSGTIGGSTGATDNAVLRADGTGGSTLQNSGVIIDDSDNMSGVGSLSLDGLNFTAPTEVTIASGVITVTQGLHIINTEGGASEDDLDTVNGLSEGEMCIISANDSSGNTILTQSGNINFIGSAGNRTYIQLALESYRVLLIGTSTGVDAHILFEPQRKQSTGLTLATGVLDLLKTEYTNIVVNAESGTSDTLTDIEGSVFSSGQHIFLRAATGDTITVQHGAGDIDLIGDTNTTLDEKHPLHLMNLSATSWVEV